MRNVLTICAKEIKSYFVSPIAYLLLGLFGLISGYFFYSATAFFVMSGGAAIRTASGRVFSGCNVENAAYPQGSCAEAGAIAAMVAGGEHDIVAVLTVCDGDAIGTCCGSPYTVADELNTMTSTPLRRMLSSRHSVP